MPWPKHGQRDRSLRGSVSPSSRGATLAELCAVGVQVVVVAEAQTEVGAWELFRKRWKRVGSRNAAKGGTVQSHIAGGAHDFETGDAAVFLNEKLNHDLALLHDGRFRNQGIPVLLHVVQH